MNAIRPVLLQRRNSAVSETSFAFLRAYEQGEDAARIDWIATARAGVPQVRVFAPDPALVFAVLLDGSASMRVGRARALIDAAHEARRAWFAAAARGDRCVHVRTFEEAVRLPREAALLAIGDWHDQCAAHEPMLKKLARRIDCTALVARDPWHDGLTLRGFTRVADLESGRTALLFVGAAQRRRYVDFMHRRERRTLETLRRCGWRAGVLTEAHGAQSVLRVFGAA